MLKANGGITLVALIITIIVLLILAGVSISMLLGENGLINKSQNAVNTYKNSVTAENDTMAAWENKINELIQAVQTNQ